MREPAFWRQDSTLLPRLLAPFGSIYAAVTARRMAQPGWVAPVPVLCCGGVTAGGAGKTPLALDLGERLIRRGLHPAFLTRGYGGSARRPRLVDAARDDASVVGDEALLLARIAPTFVSPDRAGSARAAVARGAGALVMDDGLQNPTLAKTCAVLVIDGHNGFGNGRVIPAGPLREMVSTAAARCRAAVVVGEDRAGAGAKLPRTLLVLHARLVVQRPERWAGRRVLAFAGIARPEKFWASLREAGAELVGCQAFPDHHCYSTSDLATLAHAAAETGAVLATTAKDAVRLPRAMRARTAVLEVRLVWEDEAAAERLLDELA